MPVGGNLFTEDLVEFGQFGTGSLDLFGRNFLIMKREGITDEAHFDETHQQDFMFLRREWLAFCF